MSRNINERLNQLRTRRLGVDRLDYIAEDAKLSIMANSLAGESWEKRSKAKPYTRYALGAMQEVDENYTRISIETAERVGNQLEKGLRSAGFSVAFRLQGSVPLNLHIRGVSDVDLLNLDTSFFTYATFGQMSQRGYYTPSNKTSIGVLTALRQKAEEILKVQFPAAKVDVSGGKAINVSGGSLARPVDVVPSHWNDTIEYQASGQQHDRGVTILNKKMPVTIANFPFLHIKRITDRCNVTGGGLRKAIRLCKNVKADAETEGKNITLPSFDIAAVMYHADVKALIIGGMYELAILAETQRHLDALARNHAFAKTLMIPDGSRVIFDTPEKLAGLNQLSLEMDELLSQVAKEHDTQLAKLAEPPFENSRMAVASVFVPAY